jgi:lysylphosphatidylglycerol synthetase-like protein (DUF2156 family)
LLTIAARLARNAHRAVDTLEEGQMLTIIMLILLALVILVIAAWWLFEIELPDVVVAERLRRRAPASSISTARCSLGLSGVALFLAGCAYLIYRWRRDSEARTDDKSK